MSAFISDYFTLGKTEQYVLKSFHWNVPSRSTPIYSLHGLVTQNRSAALVLIQVHQWMNRFKTQGDSLNKSPCNGIYQLINFSRSLKAKKIKRIYCTLLACGSCFRLLFVVIRAAFPFSRRRRRRRRMNLQQSSHLLKRLSRYTLHNIACYLKKYPSAKNATPTIGEGLEKSAGHSVSLCDVNPDKPVLNFKLV